MGFLLVLGGARSGKSALAVRLGLESGRAVRFIATASAGDEDMAERIRRHREDRPAGWVTVETPIDLLDAVRSSTADDFVIVDCLTLWVSNLVEAGSDALAIQAMAKQVATEMAGRRGVVVSNEVGLGIVPANELARTFRDTLGTVNQTFVACSERSVLMVAGRTLELA